MREFLIASLDKIVMVVVVLMLLGTAVSGLGTMFAGRAQGGGVLVGLFVLVSGFVGAAMFGGMMFLLIGIYENTRKMASDIADLRSRG